MSLAELSIGDVVRFDYSGPEGTSVEGWVSGVPNKHFNRVRPYIGRIEEQRNLAYDPISFETEYNYVCDRSEHLTTVVMEDRYGRFYDGRTFNVKKVGLLGRLILWFKGIKFTG